jgi:MFS family permease
MNSGLWFYREDTLVTGTMPPYRDSVFSGYGYSDTLLAAKEHFTGNYIVKFGEQAIVPLERMLHEGSSLWYSLVMFFVFLLLVLARQAWPRKFSQTLLAVSGNNHLNQLLREWSPMKHPLGMLYALSYLMMFSLFIFEIIVYIKPQAPGMYSDVFFFFIILAVVLVVLVFKFVIVSALSVLFRTQLVTQAYLANQLSFMLLGTLIFFPFLMILLYNPGATILGIAFVFVSSLMIYRLIRSFFVSLSERPFGLLYLFLYLCALEIVPLLLLVKAVVLIVSGALNA